MFFSCSKAEKPEKKDIPPSLEGDIIAFTDNGQITSFVKDGNKLWVGYSGELRCYDLDKKILLKRYKFGKEIFLSQVYQIKVMAGKVWIGTSVGLFSFDDKAGQWEVYLCGKDLPPGGVEAMDVDPEGKGLWLGVRKSKYLGESGDIRLGYLDAESGAFRGIKIDSEHISKITVTKESVWFLTYYYPSDKQRLIKFDRNELANALTRGFKSEKELTKGKVEYPYDAYTSKTYIENIEPQEDGVLVLFEVTSLEKEGKSKHEFKTIKESGEFSPFSYPSGISSLITGNGKASLWAYGNKKVYHYINKEWKDFPLGDACLRGKFIGVVEHNGTGYLIINNFKRGERINGLYDFSGEKVLDFSEHHELSGDKDFIVSLKDSHGNLWIIGDPRGFPTEVNRFNERSNTWEYIDNRKLGIQPYDESRINDEVVSISSYSERVRFWVRFQIRGEEVGGLKAFIWNPKNNALKEDKDMVIKFGNPFKVRADDPPYKSGLNQISTIRETDKDIWIQTREGWVISHDKKKGTFEIHPDKLFCSSTFDKEGIWFLWFPIGLEKNLHLAFLQLKDKEIFLYPIESSKITLRGKEPGGHARIAVDGKTVWLGIGVNLMQFDTVTKKTAQIYFLNGIEKTGIIGFIQPFQNRYLILGISTPYEDTIIEHWLWVFDKETGKSFNTNLSRHIRGISLNNLLLDEYALWVGAREGVFRIDQKLLMKLIEASVKE